MSEQLLTDFLVLGSGVAGLRAAIGLARYGSVLVVTKDQPTESNTGYAQGGVAVALGADDEPRLHLEDTIAAGAGIVSRAAAEILVSEGPERVRELAAWGARFDREEGRFHFTREAAHSHSRVLHALGDATGWEIVRTLLEKAHKTPEIEVRSFTCSTSLIVGDGAVVGCRFLSSEPRGEEVDVLARATLLATGGLGRVFAETTNPPVATGDGVGMALRAGAALLDMEFVQFHPTALAVPGAPRFLISEAVRGEGAWLVNHRHERFTDELAPRDQLARAIAREKVHGPVFLDLRHLDPERVRTRFPRICAMCLRYGIDLTKDFVPVTPAAHYSMGGVATDQDGRASIPRLYAAGEAAGNGVHGANRLASNSLLEGLVFGARAATAMGHAPSGGRLGPGAPVPMVGHNNLNLEELRRDVWGALGLERSGAGIRSFLERVSVLRSEGGDPAFDRAGIEASNLLDVAWAIGVSALFREESRGAHCRTDFPERDDARFFGHTRLEGGRASLSEVDRVNAPAIRC
jgi:L-aspartate oxidase